ncbi:hypothetical protein LTR91_009397 [Friedmanniomyces endolithicus]|uniref:Uncharacterized protein n=1 Tax=Friedmanniomyces endolithicus TaxID=329885 RepID=A0AAN6KLJ0_9PEZI|nr:hypothetical protein LTR57_003942 [Friedmanniomyces endolithicus]KAK0984408.1 hypothetical protein LTS01_010626 [Friedmanniomyces endolithicus]KAK0988875.1 hypothetical protein LTR91_009397 [Friedmanniomyces endolithicus]KAK1049469.1 hypothetical protein LTS16_003746 [Friedmanniomyces endolithicus]
MSLMELSAELLIEIIAQHLGPCFLRRHVVTNLQQMSFVQQPLKAQQPYTGRAHDSAVRRNAGFDSKELPYYAVLWGALQIYNRPLELHYLVAECAWLRKPPMDYWTFKHFCDNPSADQYHDREYLVLELFPDTDFFDPPPEITSIDATDRLNLQQRATPPFSPLGLYLVALDQRIYSGLMELWSMQIPRMPARVQRVRAIAKKAPASDLGEPFARVSQALRGLERQGRVVHRRMLFPGTPIRQ